MHVNYEASPDSLFRTFEKGTYRNVEILEFLRFTKELLFL